MSSFFVVTKSMVAIGIEATAVETGQADIDPVWTVL
jgi:hypothetical protein